MNIDHKGRRYVVVDRVYTDVDAGETDFGFRDQKGRACGYQWTIQHVVATPKADQKAGGHVRHEGEPLDYFELVTSPTRDRKQYGPAYNKADAATLDEARAIIAKRTAQARKRDAKKFNKGN